VRWRRSSAMRPMRRSRVFSPQRPSARSGNSPRKPDGSSTTSTCSRSTRLSPSSPWRRCAISICRTTRSTFMAAPARWAIRSALLARVSWSLCWPLWRNAVRSAASPRCASAAAKPPPWPSRCSEGTVMLLTETQREIRDMARDYAREKLAPTAADRDREHKFPAAEIREMGQLGFLGMTTPEAYGGSDVGAVAYACVLEEIAAGEGACSTILSVHNSVACGPIVKFGTEAQKQRFLPKLASGEWVGGFALSEPQAGSDAANLLTRAVRDGDHYVLTGTKQLITSGKNGNVIIVFAVTDPAAGKKGISAFIVPTDTPGYKVVRV